jgi:hypothetical protein
MDYATVWRDSLEILWQRKALWLFGILLALFWQGEYGVNISIQDLARYGSPNPAALPSPELDRVAPYFEEGGFLWAALANPLPTILGLGVVFLLLWMVAAFASAWARGALIGISAATDRTGAADLAEGARIGASRAAPMFIIQILLQVPLWLLHLPVIILWVWLAVQASSVFTGGGDAMPLLATSGLIILCAAPLTCIGGLAGGLLGVFYQLAARGCVIEGLGVIPSLRRAWLALAWNPVYLLLTGFIFWFAGAVYGFLAGIPLLGLWIPLARTAVFQGWALSTAANLALLGLYGFSASALMGGILTAFNQVLWTRLYGEFLKDARGLCPAILEESGK